MFSNFFCFHSQTFSEMLRRAIKENFAKVMVLPNKFVFPLVDDFKTKTIKFNQPIGLVRLELIEAKQLKKADVGMLGEWCRQS